MVRLNTSIETALSEEKNKNMCRLIIKILKRKRFTYVMIATSILFFVISGIQFWASDYMRLVLEIPEEIVIPAFSIITLTGPTVGCIVGGGLTHLIGGYEHPNALKLILYVGFIGTIISLPIPFVDHTPTFLILFWLSLFAGGFIMPGTTGIMINAAPKKHKALANSIAYVSYNLLGYVPGPLVYGVLTHFYGDRSKIGMIALIWALIFCIFFIFLAYKNTPIVEEIIKERGFIPTKEYKESDSESEFEERRQTNRRVNRDLRVSFNPFDYSMRGFDKMEESFRESLITPMNADSPNRGSSTNPNRFGSLRKNSLLAPTRLTKRVSESRQPVQGVTRKKKSRAVSLFDNNIMSMGIGGQPNANLFQFEERHAKRTMKQKPKDRQTYSIYE